MLRVYFIDENVYIDTTNVCEILITRFSSSQRFREIKYVNQFSTFRGREFAYKSQVSLTAYLDIVMRKPIDYVANQSWSWQVISPGSIKRQTVYNMQVLFPLRN